MVLLLLLPVLTAVAAGAWFWWLRRERHLTQRVFGGGSCTARAGRALGSRSPSWLAELRVSDWSGGGGSDGDGWWRWCCVVVEVVEVVVVVDGGNEEVGLEELPASKRCGEGGGRKRP